MAAATTQAGSGASNTSVFPCDSRDEEAGKEKGWVGETTMVGLFPSLKPLPRAHSHRSTHSEDEAARTPPPSSSCPHLPASPVTLAAPQRKAARFPPLPLLYYPLQSPYDGFVCVCGPNTPAQCRRRNTQRCPTVSTPFHSSTFAVPTSSRCSRRTLPPPFSKCHYILDNI